jgi:hypothetical protein
LVSTLITGWPAAIASVTVWLMCANCASRSGVLGALARLLVRLQAVAPGLQQPQHSAIDDIVAHRAQRLRQLRAALRRPAQRRLRIAARHRVHEPLKILREPRLALEDRHPPAMAAHPARQRPLTGLKLGQPAQHRRLRDPRRAHDRRDPATPRRASLRRRPQPPPALIQHALRAQQPKPLGDRALINHDQRVLHKHPKPFKGSVVSPNRSAP